MPGRFFFIVACALVITFGIAFPADAERITSFDAAIVVDGNSVITVTEKIEYDFGSGERHGIYRDIPYRYTRSGNTYTIRIAVASVIDGTGAAWPYTTSRSGGTLHIKIGDPAEVVTGPHTYAITYTVERAINYFGDHDELYWNVTGHNWPVGIESSSATVQLPRPLTDAQRLAQCFTGATGNTESHCSSAYLDDTTVRYTTDQILSSYEGLTLVLGWPSGITVPPTAGQRIWWFVQDNWAVAIPFLVLSGMYYLWLTRGRDPQGRRTIVPQYDAPDRLAAGLVGTIVDEKAQLRDVSASIIHLAVKGYLEVVRHEEKKIIGSKVDYEFLRVRLADATLNQFERDIMTALFDGSSTSRLSDLKNKFYRHLPTIRKSMYAAVTSEGYFPISPEHVRSLYGILAIVVIILGFSIIFFNSTVAGILTSIAGLGSLFIAQHMPRKTNKGVLAHEHIQGLTWFLKVTEKERLKFHNAPERSPKQFEQLLPYAMALGVETQWAGQFADMYVTPPEWYSGGSTDHFSALFLVLSLQSLSHDFRSVAMSSPSSAGGGSGFSGGFSGGGFGGGGGGSW